MSRGKLAPVPANKEVREVVDPVDAIEERRLYIGEALEVLIAERARGGISSGRAMSADIDLQEFEVDPAGADLRCAANRVLTGQVMGGRSSGFTSRRK